MDLRDGPEQAAFRAQIREWLEANLPPGWACRGGEAAWRPSSPGRPMVDSPQLEARSHHKRGKS